ncbi:MAG: hypothetical protein QGI83_14095 [Candidatus Latescibacteria bacterium]|nr:hypothetical protein [Candidatus Latescibacterota bacterium]
MDIGTRLELFCDHECIDELKGGARLHLHTPERREVVLVHDTPWEGNTSGYHTVLNDDGAYRMYYRGWHTEDQKEVHPAVVCYAEGEDGIFFVRPHLDIAEFEGSTANNIIIDDNATHNFTPFIDANPDCPEEERFKGIGRGDEGYDKKKLYAFKSANGVHWSPLHPDPLPIEGAFDSENLAFWDTVTGQYRIYFRLVRDGCRDIRTATSDDFLTWSEPVWLEYPGSPREHLYTNQVMPYFRAPHIYLGFPTRFIKERGQITEGLLMTSRDGRTFNRWGEAIIRPGANREKWGNRCNYIWNALVQTESDLPGAPPELSIYSSEAYYEGVGARTRRYVYRMDGFVSVRAPLSGGEVVTVPLVFGGGRLVVNFSTSAAGSLQIEILDAEGSLIPGFAISDCPEVYGDEIDRVWTWEGSSDLSALIGKPVRLRFCLSDADVYSFRFVEAGEQ